MGDNNATAPVGDERHARVGKDFEDDRVKKERTAP